MKLIEHDRNDTRKQPMVWPWVWLIVAVLWIGGLYYFKLDVFSLALGAGTGLMLMAWAGDITGGRWPFSTPRGRDRNP